MHQTPSSIVVKGTDRLHDHAPVALKFMRSKRDYEREVAIADRDKPNKYIAALVETGWSTERDRGMINEEDVGEVDGRALARLNLPGMHLVVIERGLNDLADEISRNLLEPLQVVEIAKDVAEALQFMNETHKISHGDVKLRNFIKTRTADGGTRWKAIDMDGSCRHMDTIGAKISTACCPPEMARLRYRYLYEEDVGKAEDGAILFCFCDCFATVFATNSGLFYEQLLSMRKLICWRPIVHPISSWLGAKNARLLLKMFSHLRRLPLASSQTNLLAVAWLHQVNRLVSA